MEKLKMRCEELWRLLVHLLVLQVAWGDELDLSYLGEGYYPSYDHVSILPHNRVSPINATAVCTALGLTCQLIGTCAFSFLNLYGGYGYGRKGSTLFCNVSSLTVCCGSSAIFNHHGNYGHYRKKRALKMLQRKALKSRALPQLLGKPKTKPAK